MCVCVCVCVGGGGYENVCACTACVHVLTIVKELQRVWYLLNGLSQQKSP